AGLELKDLEAKGPVQPYHFDETKSIAAAQQTDFHYFRVAQYLRLSRRAMALAGLDLISATPGSRLNSFFPYRPAEKLLTEIADEVGDPSAEVTRGQYGRRDEVRPPGAVVMKDFRPHNWPNGARGPVRPHRPATNDDLADARRQKLAEAIEDLPEVEVRVQEEG
ncbi:MAG TPA: hypothetical protein VM510_15150, partial [Caulifigura sp.]|nr:hypothetical protein [Caulifigura sp.]